MSPPKNPKRNHHHVWQSYLKPWTIDGKIWCSTQGIVEFKRTKHIAVDRDFYKLHQLTAEDLANLACFISQGGVRLQKTNQQLLDLLQKPFKIIESAQPLSDSAKIAWERFLCEALEDYHSKIEDSCSSFLRYARDGELRFDSEAEKISLIRYLCVQYMRTKGIKEKSLAAMSEFNISNFSRIWNIIALMAANNIGESLYLDRRSRHLQLLRNESKTLFIAGDQPVVNLWKSKNGVAPDKLVLYYPISPKIALYWGEVGEDPLPTEVSESQALHFNERIREASYLQYFGASKFALLVT